MHVLQIYISKLGADARRTCAQQLCSKQNAVYKAAKPMRSKPPGFVKKRIILLRPYALGSPDPNKAACLAW